MLKDFLEGKPLRHPLHTLLVHFPIGLLTLSFLLDIGSFLFPSSGEFVRCSFYSMMVGVIMSLVAAVPGFVDYNCIRNDHPANRIATAHMLLNLLMVGVYAVNLGFRASSLNVSPVPTAPFILSIVGMVLLSVSGYLGGAMVYDDGIAVGRHRRTTPVPEETLQFSTSHLQAEPSGLVFVELLFADHLGEGETLRVEIDSQVLVIAKHDGAVHALQEFCTHRYGPLSEGSIKEGQITCPWHGSCFELKTGKVRSGPAKVDLKTFRVEIRNRKICVGIPKEGEKRLAA